MLPPACFKLMPLHFFTGQWELVIGGGGGHFLCLSPDQDTSSSTASKNKWKDMLLNFLHTLNLLIGMCENALNTKEDIETPAESGAATNAAETTNESTSVSGDNADKKESSEENHDKKDNDKIETEKTETKSETLQDEEENITSSN